MSKMSPEERQSRRDRVAAEALESVAKSEQFNFRMDAETIKLLYKVAAQQRKPVGALVREWVLEKLHPQQKEPSPAELMQEIQRLRQQNMSCFEALAQRIISLGGGVSSHQAPLVDVRNISSAHQDAPDRGGSDAFDSCPRLAESITSAYMTPSSVPLDISKPELLKILNNLRTTRSGHHEVPDWLVDYFKHQVHPT